MKKTKYKIIHLEASKGLGGQERRIVSECQSFMEEGHDMEIICQPDAQMIPLMQEKGIPFITLKMKGAVDVFAISFLIKHFKERNVDIVHSHSSIDSWVGGLAGKIAGVPLVARTRHVSIPVKNSLVYKFLTDVIFTTGGSIKRMFEEKHNIPEDKVISIPTGVDMEKFNPSQHDGNAVRKELNIDKDTLIVSIIGVIRWWKGQRFFIEAAKKVLKEQKMVFLIVGGSAANKITFEDKLVGFEENIRLLGHRDDIPEILAATDILVSASLANEGVSQALLQGLAMRKGVVATDVGASSEIVRTNETGLLIPHSDSSAMAEAILKLGADKEMRGKFGEMGRKLVSEEYALSDMVGKITEVYRKFLD